MKLGEKLTLTVTIVIFLFSQMLFSSNMLYSEPNKYIDEAYYYFLLNNELTFNYSSAEKISERYKTDKTILPFDFSDSVYIAGVEGDKLHILGDPTQAVKIGEFYLKLQEIKNSTNEIPYSNSASDIEISKAEAAINLSELQILYLKSLVDLDTDVLERGYDPHDYFGTYKFFFNSFVFSLIFLLLMVVEHLFHSEILRTESNLRKKLLNIRKRIRKRK